ncbi:MAG: hypothetical protein LCH30_11120 [Proteobacteria bacterium]|nr:hypothetical protein [Pseudomonadota bacterium]
MFGWIARILFSFSGSIASFFVAKDALNFPIIQMVVSVLLFTILVFTIAFWPNLKAWYKRIRKK